MRLIISAAEISGWIHLTVKLLDKKLLREGNSPVGATFPDRLLGQKNDSLVALHRPELNSQLQKICPQKIFFNLLASLYNSLVSHQEEPFASPVV